MSSTPNQPKQDDWIRVTSRDGFSFIVKRSVVFRSGTLRNMLDERRTSPSLQPLTALPCSFTPFPDSFTEAVQKVCPVDERYLSFFAQVFPRSLISQGRPDGEIRRVPRLQDNLRKRQPQR
jgi:hypothetical protein